MASCTRNYTLIKIIRKFSYWLKRFPKYQDCKFNLQSGHIQDATNEMHVSGTKMISPSLSHSLSLSPPFLFSLKINKLNFLKRHLKKKMQLLKLYMYQPLTSGFSMILQSLYSIVKQM